MNNQLPYQENLPISELSNIYKSVSASYKFYWFLSVLDLYSSTGNRKIGIWNLVADMVAHAWYTINYFRISFGKQDSLESVINELTLLLHIPMDASKVTVYNTILSNIERPEIKQALRILTINVPYRFLNPWLHESSDRTLALKSLSYQNNCLYALHVSNEESYIEINPIWCEYLKKHCRILIDYSYWNLALFLQRRNPNCPNIPNKLIRPQTRESLSKQRDYWNAYIANKKTYRCIFTDVELSDSRYDLDHFIPWSFVTHNLIWNLIPINPSINSSKSDKIPDLDFYLPLMAKEQHEALKINAANRTKENKLFEDFTAIGYTINELLPLSDDDFLDIYHKTFSPLAQIALNMGFEQWIYNRNGN